jgi:hypothetical protein
VEDGASRRQKDFAFDGAADDMGVRSDGQASSTSRASASASDFDRATPRYRAGSLLPAIVLTPPTSWPCCAASSRTLRFRKGMSAITLGAILLYGRSRLRWVARGQQHLCRDRRRAAVAPRAGWRAS